MDQRETSLPYKAGMEEGKGNRKREVNMWKGLKRHKVIKITKNVSSYTHSRFSITYLMFPICLMMKSLRFLFAVLSHMKAFYDDCACMRTDLQGPPMLFTMRSLFAAFSLSVCSCCMLMTKNMVFQCHPYWKALTCNRRHKSQPITHISKHTASLLGKMTGQAIRYWFILSDTVASNLNSLTIQVCRVEDLLKSSLPT